MAKDRRKLAREVNRLDTNNSMLKANYDLLMSKMIEYCDSEGIVQVLNFIWNNGVTLEDVNNMKGRRGI